MKAVPSGTVTFAFTDIEGSTHRWEHNRAAMQDAVRRHDALVRDAIVRHRGYVFKTVGDSFCAAFARPADAAAAMLDAQRALSNEDFSALDGLRVRAAIHTGTADERGGDYFGPAVNRVARLLAIGHGGQTLVSAVTSAIVAGELPPDATLRDLGEHALRDVAQPERVYQLDAPGLPGDFPPLRSRKTRASNFPAELTSFVGREREIDEIAALVRTHRLVTLVGAGGVGKTRTGLRVAGQVLDDFGDGAWFVDLAPLSHGDHIPATMARALGIKLPASGDSIEHLISALKTKKALLILDNCEHMIDAVVRVVPAVLNACPGVNILASSRQSLEVAGEQTYYLPSLETPVAVQLFVERARCADAGFALTDENAAALEDVCRSLDGIPLAIELAASRANVLGIKQLSEKLHERFRLLTAKSGTRLPRQQTLRALIDWSFDLLDARERALFGRLSVFAGGWTLPAAAAVCSDDANDEWEILELLSALVSKSLVVADTAGGDERRYRMLNSIREYGRDRLRESDELAPTAARHAAYFAEMTNGLAPLVTSLEDVRWKNALAPEIDNLRTALDWTIFRANERHVGLRLLSHLEWPELVTTPQEANTWFDAAVKALGDTPDRLVRARVLRHHVRLEWLVGKPPAQREAHAKTGLAAARASEDPNEVAHALAILGSVYRDCERFEDAEEAFGEAHRADAMLSPITRNALLRNWAVSDLQRGNIESARRRFTDVAQRERRGSEAHASALLNIGELEFATGNVEAARKATREASETFRKLNAAPLALAVCNLAAYALAVGELEEARTLLAQALDVLKRTGARWTTTALEHHALLAGLLHDHARAALLVGYTDARYAGHDTRQTTERIGYERLMDLLRQEYDEAELSRRTRVGADLTEEQAMDVATTIHANKGE